jgi:hypothetical protein
MADERDEQAAPRVEENPGEPAAASFVYALGQIDLRFPSMGVEREFAQASTRVDIDELTAQEERRLVKAVLSDADHRYLARQVCWVFLIQGFESYIVLPRDPADFALLVETYRESPDPDGVDVLIGTLGQTAPSEACGGMALPIVAFDELYSFARGTFVNAIPPPESVADDGQFRRVAARVFDRIVHMANNAGMTDEHRALNYLAMRYPQIYAAAAQQDADGAMLSGLVVRRSSLSSMRTVVDVIFSYSLPESDIPDRQFVRVDVSDQHPFLASGMARYHEPL